MSHRPKVVSHGHVPLVSICLVELQARPRKEEAPCTAWALHAWDFNMASWSCATNLLVPCAKPNSFLSAHGECVHCTNAHGFHGCHALTAASNPRSFVVDNGG